MENPLKDSYRYVIFTGNPDWFYNQTKDEDAKLISAELVIWNPSKDFIRFDYDEELDLFLDDGDARRRKIMNIISSKN